MQNKKIILIFLVILLSISGLTYYIYTKGDKKTTLNLLEKQWIEKNKNNIIDMGIVSDIPIFTENGNGLFFDFLTSLGDETGLSFNYVPSAIDKKNESEYSLVVTTEKEDSDILVYSDNYVVIGRENVKAMDPSNLKRGTIGVVASDLEKVNRYINSSNVSYKSYETVDALKEAFSTSKVSADEKTTYDIDMMVLPKVLYMKLIREGNYYINYQITELNKHYVIRLGEIDKLNDILTKYYKKWSKDNYDTVFASYFSKSYFNYNLINEKETVNFKSKNYNYGYVDSIPFDFEINGKLYGISSQLLKAFEKRSNIDINFIKYKSVFDLNEAFENSKIDLMINYLDKDDKSTNFYNRKYIVASKNENALVINSLNSLEGMEVSITPDSYIESVLEKASVKIKKYDTLEELVSKASKNTVLFIDVESFNIYAKNKLDDYKVSFEIDLQDYNYRFSTKEENKVFNNYLDFFIAFENNHSIYNDSKLDIIENYGKINIKLGLYISISVFIVISLTGFILLKLTKKKAKKVKLISKEDKLRYIDMLTSLKNRNYLNDNLEKWDDSEVYPQAILVIDLNNVAYINDNYGHAEGDNVIREAANILIMTQESGSDIIRTSGNEFLIYLVGHDEKSVVAYKRKLTKEFRDISHGFGAAIGYSMIVDGIKTIDDAINEATLDMRNNKESQTN